jgi:hypothetical protein
MCAELREALRRVITDEEAFKAEEEFRAMKFQDPLASEEENPASPSEEEMHSMSKEKLVAYCLRVRSQRDDLATGRKGRKRPSNNGEIRLVWLYYVIICLEFQRTMPPTPESTRMPRTHSGQQSTSGMNSCCRSSRGRWHIGRTLTRSLVIPERGGRQRSPTVTFESSGVSAGGRL